MGVTDGYERVVYTMFLGCKLFQFRYFIVQFAFSSFPTHIGQEQYLLNSTCITYIAWWISIGETVLRYNDLLLFFQWTFRWFCGRLQYLRCRLAMEIQQCCTKSSTGIKVSPILKTRRAIFGMKYILIWNYRVILNIRVLSLQLNWQIFFKTCQVYRGIEETAVRWAYRFLWEKLLITLCIAEL